MPICTFQWFLEKLGHDGLNNMLASYSDKSAYAQCIFAFSRGPGDEPVVFSGRCPGTIVPARGKLDFGYFVLYYGDTIFFFPHLQCALSV